MLPRLPKRGRTGVVPCWQGELGESVLRATMAAMDAVRRQQLDQPGTKAHHCQPARTDSALDLIDTLAGGSAVLGLGEPELVFKRAKNKPHAWWDDEIVEEVPIPEPMCTVEI